MKCRRVSFFIHPEQVNDVTTAIDTEVLPRFLALPHFLGLTALQSEVGSRTEMIVLSLWDDQLEDSESISEAFRDRIQRATGMTPERQAFDIVRMTMKGADGDVCIELP